MWEENQDTWRGLKVRCHEPLIPGRLTRQERRGLRSSREVLETRNKKKAPAPQQVVLRDRVIEGQLLVKLVSFKTFI